MKKQKKFLAVLSAAAVSTMIAAAVSTTAFAKTTDVIAKINGQEVKINFEELTTAYENKAAGLDSELFNKYNEREGLTALLDDKNGFVDYKAVQEAAEDAVALGEKFVLNDFTETTEKTLADFKPEAEWKDDKVVPVTPVEEDLKVESVSAINTPEGDKLEVVLSDVPEEKPTATSVTVTRTINGEEDASFVWGGGVSSWNEETKTLTISEITPVEATEEVQEVVYSVAYGDTDAVAANALTVEAVEKGLAVESVSAINAKTIEVTFNNAVDTEKAEIELLRGTFKQNVTVKWAEDKKSVELIGAGNFQAADYTVSVTGLTEEALSGAVKVEAQKVAKIEILDDVAVLSESDMTKATATVSYKVLDQYGEDITKTADIKTNDANKITLTKADGLVKISNDIIKDKKAGDTVVIVLINDKSGVTESRTVKLSDESAVDTIEVTGIYNEKGKELNEDSKAAEFFLVLELKDQYGKEIKDVELAKKLLVTSTDEKVVKVQATDIVKKTIDKVDKLVLPLASIEGAGKSTILLISPANGNKTEYEVVVAETTRTDAVQLGQPEIAVVGEDILLPLTVQDKEGNVVLDKKVLEHATKGIKIDGKDAKVDDNLVIKDEQAYVKIAKASNTTATHKTVVVTSSTNEVATVTFEVKKEAKATVVRGFKEPLVIKAGATATEITADLLNIEDQYGRIMKDTTKVNVKVENITGDDKVVTVSNNNVTGQKNGEAKIVVSIEDVENSAAELTVKVTDGKEYASYEIEELGKVEFNKDKALVINGVLENGGKVALGNDEYSATVELDTVGGAVAVTAGNLKVNNMGTVDGKAATKATGTLKVTINATGDVIEQEFVVLIEAPKVKDFFFTTETESTDADAIKKAKEYTKTLELEDEFNLTALKAGLNVLTTDQFGNKAIVAIADEAVLTIVPEDITKVNIVKNGTKDAAVTLEKDVEEAEVTVKVKIDDAVKELKVVVKAKEVEEVVFEAKTKEHSLTGFKTITTVESSEKDVATAVATEATGIKITSLKKGTATITVTGTDDSDGEKTATVEVTVAEDGTITATDK